MNFIEKDVIDMAKRTFVDSMGLSEDDLLDEELSRDISLELDKDLDIDYIFISNFYISIIIYFYLLF